jgi:hypothetical protein
MPLKQTVSAPKRPFAVFFDEMDVAASINYLQTLSALLQAAAPIQPSRLPTAHSDAAYDQHHFRNSSNQLGNTCRIPSRFAQDEPDVLEIFLPFQISCPDS